jgi:protein-L-isoaspartate(D-aspartate) O-methyltransferase
MILDKKRDKREINTNNKFIDLRKNMVENQIQTRGIKNQRVLDAMMKVPRHLFVPEGLRRSAYNDEPLPIGEGQTISQPYIVAYMTEKLELAENDRVLEIGTGCGYQSAILAEIARDVYTVEIVSSLSLRAKKTLHDLGYDNIHFCVGDGYKGWPNFSPYDAIMVTAAPPRMPDILKKQLRVGGKMLVPVGEVFQELVLVSRAKNKFLKKSLLPVRFVPMINTH